MTENTGGRPTKVSTEEVIEAFKQVDEPMTTAPELADILGVSSQTVTRRLNVLKEDSEVGKKKVGARTIVWWVLDS